VLLATGLLARDVAGLPFISLCIQPLDVSATTAYVSAASECLRDARMTNAVFLINFIFLTLSMLPSPVSTFPW